MENLIPIVVKFKADWLLQINFAQVRLFWAILDQPKVCKMYRKGPRESTGMQINYLTNRRGIEVFIGPKWNDWKVIPPKVIENVKKLTPSCNDGTDIKGFNEMEIYLPIEEDLVNYKYNFICHYKIN